MKVSEENLDACRMRPSLLQKLFARDLIWSIGFYGIAISITLALAIQPDDWRQVLVLLVAGAGCGALVGWLVLKVLYHIRVWINGGPFHRNDVVQIISGIHAGKIVSVYEEWRSRGQVRVELGDWEESKVKDVFSYTQLLRIEQKTKTPQPLTADH